MPVGRVQFLFLRPLSFGEYLEATQNDLIQKYLETVQIENPFDEAVHGKLLSLVREYIALGGMPAVIAEYVRSKNLLECQSLQNAILTAYRNDFGKYAERSSYLVLETVFTKMPGLLGKWLKYTSIDPNLKAEVLREALHKLADAGLLLPVFATSGAGIPLVAHKNEKNVNSFFLMLDS